MPPKISVCIPVYNGDKFIKDAIDSVFAQTFKDFEILVLDNNSTDKTIEIVTQYIDARLRIIKNPENIGVERNFNLALSEARGEYVKILCADDMLHPECLDKQCRIFDMKNNHDVVLVSCLRKIINQKNKVLMTRGLKTNGIIKGSSAIKMILRAGTNLIGEPSAVLIRKSVLDRTGGFNGTIPYIIDLDLWLRILLNGCMYAIAEPLCCFRISRGSWSVAIRKNQQRDFIQFMNKIYNNKIYGIKLFDYLAGRSNAAFNAFKRNLFYKLIWLFSSTLN